MIYLTPLPPKMCIGFVVLTYLTMLCNNAHKSQSTQQGVALPIKRSVDYVFKKWVYEMLADIGVTVGHSDVTNAVCVFT